MKKIIASLAVLLAVTGLTIGCTESDETKASTEQVQGSSKNDPVATEKTDQDKNDSHNTKTNFLGV